MSHNTKYTPFMNSGSGNTGRQSSSSAQTNIGHIDPTESKDSAATELIERCTIPLLEKQDPQKEPVIDSQGIDRALNDANLVNESLKKLKPSPETHHIPDMQKYVDKSNRTIERNNEFLSKQESKLKEEMSTISAEIEKITSKTAEPSLKDVGKALKKVEASYKEASDMKYELLNDKTCFEALKKMIKHVEESASQVDHESPDMKTLVSSLEVFKFPQHYDPQGSVGVSKSEIQHLIHLDEEELARDVEYLAHDQEILNLLKSAIKNSEQKVKFHVESSFTSLQKEIEQVQNMVPGESWEVVPSNKHKGHDVEYEGGESDQEESESEDSDSHEESKGGDIDDPEGDINVDLLQDYPDVHSSSPSSNIKGPKVWENTKCEPHSRTKSNNENYLSDDSTSESKLPTKLPQQRQNSNSRGERTDINFDEKEESKYFEDDSFMVASSEESYIQLEKVENNKGAQGDKAATDKLKKESVLKQAQSL